MATPPEPSESSGPSRELSFRELAARADDGQDGDAARGPAVDRSDELLDELPPHDHHLGRLGGWRATRHTRLIVGSVLGLALLVGATIFILHSREQRRQRLHPLPEVEALIAPGTEREMTVADGEMIVGLGAEPPAINLLHLPDRDITLARGSDKAQLKVVVREGKTVKIVVRSGEIVETLTAPGAKPLR